MILSEQTMQNLSVADCCGTELVKHRTGTSYIVWLAKNGHRSYMHDAAGDPCTFSVPADAMTALHDRPHLVACIASQIATNAIASASEKPWKPDLSA